MKNLVAILSVIILCSFLCLLLFASSKGAPILRKARSAPSKRNLPERFSHQKSMVNSTDSCPSGSRKQTPQLTGLNILENVGQSKMSQKFINDFLRGEKYFTDIRKYIRSESKYIKLSNDYPVIEFSINSPSLECLMNSKISDLFENIDLLKGKHTKGNVIQITSIPEGDIDMYFAALKTVASYFNELIEKSGPSSTKWSWDETQCRLDHRLYVEISISQQLKYNIFLGWKKNHQRTSFLDPSKTFMRVLFRNDKKITFSPELIKSMLQTAAYRYLKLPTEHVATDFLDYNLRKLKLMKEVSELPEEERYVVPYQPNRFSDFESCTIFHFNNPLEDRKTCYRKYYKYPSASYQYRLESLKLRTFQIDVFEIYKSGSISFEQHMQDHSSFSTTNSYLDLKNSAKYVETFDLESKNYTNTPIHSPLPSLRLANDEYNEKIKTVDDPILVENKEEFNEFFKEINDLSDFQKLLRKYPEMESE